MAKRYVRQPGSDQITKWKAAQSAWYRQQRNRRGKRTTGIARADGPGMIRRPAPRRDGAGEQDGNVGQDGDGNGRAAGARPPGAAH